jgi:hypothetical protein
MTRRQQCNFCYGTGTAGNRTCNPCGGEGTIPVGTGKKASKLRPNTTWEKALQDLRDSFRNAIFQELDKTFRVRGIEESKHERTWLLDSAIHPSGIYFTVGVGSDRIYLSMVLRGALGDKARYGEDLDSMPLRASDSPSSLATKISRASLFFR